MNKQYNEVLKYVEELHELGRRSFDDLRLFEGHKLTALIIRSESKFDQWDFINETDYDDLPLDLADILSDTNGMLLLSRLKNAAVRYAQNEIERLFENLASNQQGEVDNEPSK